MLDAQKKSQKEYQSTQTLRRRRIDLHLRLVFSALCQLTRPFFSVSTIGTPTPPTRRPVPTQAISSFLHTLMDNKG